MSSIPDLTIVTVSWNCRALLDACLRSVFAHSGRSELEVFVVDNASADDTVAMVHARFPQVRLIANQANLGFAVANNMAIRQSRGRYILLLNPDTEIPDETLLDRLVEFMDENVDVGAAGCALMDFDGNLQNSAGYRIGPRTLFGFSFFLPHLTGNVLKSFCLPPVDRCAPETIDVDWVCAACMVVRRSILDEVGLLDENIFMYGEDLDWGRRMNERGWRVTHLPALRVKHVLAGTQKSENAIATAWLDGLARYYMETSPRRSWYYFKICLGSGFALRAALAGLEALVLRRARSRRRAAEFYFWLKYLMRMHPPIVRGRCGELNSN
jgi:N-acetylglucosaminyl-diphospho-decaprenol L-rhamnosyltransferase